MTTIGDLPRPRTKSEYCFVIFELLIGLLTFATVLGFIANIVTNVSAARKDFQGESHTHTSSTTSAKAIVVKVHESLPVHHFLVVSSSSTVVQCSMFYYYYDNVEKYNNNGVVFSSPLLP